MARGLAIGPDLAVMHRVDSLRQNLDGLIAKNDTASAAAEGIDYQLSLSGIKQHDSARAVGCAREVPKYSVTLESAIFQFCADDGDVRLLVFDQSKCLICANR